jgi:hypothetical protein
MSSLEISIPPCNSLSYTAGATSTVLEAEDLTNGERRALKVGFGISKERGKASAFVAKRQRQQQQREGARATADADDSRESLALFWCSSSSPGPVVPPPAAR